MKKFFLLIFGLTFFLFNVQVADAGWVNGYFKSNGTYVNGYYRTEPDYYKWNNYSFNNDWNDAYNDRSWYKDYGYDPEPWDDEYVGSTYNSYDYYDSYDYNSYDYDYYDSYDYYDWNW